MRNVSVSLTAGNQIEVILGSESRMGECYYLGLQAGSEHHEFRPVEGASKLVSEWIRLIVELKDGQQLFLPFDFSDEYTRWITLYRDRRDVTILFGWAAVEGWLISPRDLALYAHRLPGFMPDEPLHVQTFYLPGVLSNLRHSLANLSLQASQTASLNGGKDDSAT